MRVLRILVIAVISFGVVFSFVSPVNAATTTTQTPIEQCRTILAQPKGVLFIGDSLTAMGFDTITAQFTAAGKHVCINGLGGQSTALGVAVLTTYVNAGVLSPDTQIVMALGTNDVLHTAVMQSGIDATLALVGRRRLIWVNVYNGTGFFGWIGRLKCLAGSKVVNQIIASNVKAHPTMVSVDLWGMVVLTNLRLIYCTNSNGGVHTTPTGSYYRTQMTLAKVA